MNKSKQELDDELRPNYRREDFGDATPQRGRYAAKGMVTASVVVLDPENAKAFPDDKAVNDALHVLLAAAKATAQI